MSMIERDKTALRDSLLRRYPGTFHKTVAVREFVESTCIRHMERDLGDSDILAKLCSEDDACYWQQLSEVLLANELTATGLALVPSHEGPDFLFKHKGRNVWIEVICPQPTGVPAEWLAPVWGRARSYPHDALLLRWTAAIKEKTEKLLGNATQGTKGYLEKKVVGGTDIYVIAINARLLRGPHFPSITGISQLPYALEAAFAVGPLTIQIDPSTLEQVSSGHAHRPLLRKPNGAAVPAYTFLDPAFSSVSAIWAADIDESWVLGNAKPMTVVHNPSAINSLPLGALPAFEEYVATQLSADEYELQSISGTLSRS